MLKDLIREGGLYTVSNILTKGIGLLLIPFYTTYFSPADYGIIDLLNLFVVFMNAVFTLQLGQGVARYVAESKLTSNQKKLFSSSAVWFVVIVFSIVTLVLLLFPDWMIHLLSNEQQIPRKTFRLATAVMLLNSIFYLTLVVQRFSRKVLQFTIMSFLHSILGIGLILYFVMVQDMGIDSIYLSYLIIVLPLLLIQFYLLKGLIVFNISKRALRKLLVYSVPLIPASISLALMNFSDRLIIKEYQDDFGDIGIYAMAARFASILGFVIAGFSMSLAPMVIEKYDREETKPQLSRIFRLYISIGASSVLLLSFFSKEIVYLITESSFHRSADVLPIMLLTIFFTGLPMFSLGLKIRKKSMTVAALVVSFAALNIVLNYIFIPLYGLYGAAASTLIASASYYTLNFFISQKNYNFDYPKFKIAIALFTLFLLVSLFIYWNPVINLESALIKSGLLIFYLWLMRILGLINYKRVFKELLSKLN